MAGAIQEGQVQHEDEQDVIEICSLVQRIRRKFCDRLVAAVRGKRIANAPCSFINVNQIESSDIFVSQRSSSPSMSQAEVTGN